jgi:hypothetical protein
MTNVDKFRDTIGRTLDELRADPTCTISDLKMFRLIETVVSETAKLFERMETNEKCLLENSKSN